MEVVRREELLGWKLEQKYWSANDVKTHGASRSRQTLVLYNQKRYIQQCAESVVYYVQSVSQATQVTTALRIAGRERERKKESVREGCLSGSSSNGNLYSLIRGVGCWCYSKRSQRIEKLFRNDVDVRLPLFPISFHLIHLNILYERSLAPRRWVSSSSSDAIGL